MNWPKSKLKDLGEIVTGSTPSISNESFYGGEIPFVTPSELDSIEPIVRTPRTLTQAGADVSRVIPEGSVMVCCIGSLGKIGIAGRSMVTNQQINSIIFNDKKVNKKYGFYACKRLKNELVSIAPATTVPIVNKTRFSELTIPLPCLEQQQRIAAILDKAEEIKCKRELAINRLELLAESIFEKIESSKEFQKFPIVKLGDVLELQRGGSPRPISDWITEDEDGINWIKIGDATVSDKYIYSCKQKIKRGGERHSRMVYEGDFLLSNSMSFGRPYILKTSGCIHDGWLVLRDKAHNFEQDYLYSLLSSPTVKRQFTKLASGAVVKNLNIDAVSKVEIRLLDKKSQLKFSKEVGVLETYKDKLKLANLLQNQLLLSIQSKVFSGQ